MKPQLLTCLLALPLTAWTQGTTGAPVIAEAGPHHRVLQWTTTERDEAGNEVILPHQVTELGTGLNWLNPLTRQWEESVEAFEITPQGYAIARRGQLKALLAPNIRENPAVDLELPSGQRLRSNPRFLSFFDTASGQSVLLAEVKDCLGELVASNVIVFPDAFDNLKAALRYTYTKSGFEQDVILYENPGSPGDHGLDPASSRLELSSEFFDPPTPRRVRRLLADGLEDERLEFDTVTIGEGSAYVLGQSLESVEVLKTWARLDGLDFLVESVPYLRVRPLLERAGLAKAESGAGTKTVAEWKQAQGRAGLVRLLASRRDETTGGRLVASIRPQGILPQPGVVLDYRVDLPGGGPPGGVFLSDTTYNITGDVTISTGTAVFEAGTILKSAAGKKLTITTPITWTATLYRPVILTAKDDDSAGEIVPGSTHTPSGYYANPALEIRTGGTQLKHLRVAHAQVGVFFYDFSAGNGNSVDHAQFVNCGTALQFNGYGTTFQNFRVGNVLMHNVGTAFYGYSFHGTLEHLTLDAVTTLAYDYQGASYGTSSSLSFLNSLLVNVGAAGGNPPVTVTYDPLYTKTASSGSGIFQQAGAGYHYLVAGSTYRNAGSTAINPNLAADLRQMTTDAPATLTSLPGYPLAPRAARDTDPPDLGAHYGPLDYLCSQINVGGSTLVLTNGVAVGLYGNYGFAVGVYGVIACEGRPEAMNRLVWYPSAQEQPIKLNGVPTGGSGMVSLAYGTPNPRPALRFRFTDLAALGRRQLFFYGSSYPDLFSAVSFTDCWLRGLDITSQWYPGPATGYGTPTVSLTNNALERATVSLFNGYQCSGQNCYTQPLAVNLYNNLFWNTSVLLTYKDSGASQHPDWNIKDNLYDNATNIVTTTGSYQSHVHASNNGYVNYTSAPVPTALRSSADVPPSSGFISFSYAPTLGARRWLHLSTDMLDKGSRTAADAGVYHHTVRPESIKEGEETTATVDIGYHYPAAANVALRRAATQSSTYVIPNDVNGHRCRPLPAGFAVDGNTDGNCNHYSVAITGNDTHAWWEIDLGAVHHIASISLWNRTDCCGEWLSNFYLFVSDVPFQSTDFDLTRQQAGVSAFPFPGQAGIVTGFNIGRTGRYVRVQFAGQNSLDLAEVQVFTDQAADDDRDGLPDCFEDRNGNGTFETGDLANWTDADTDDDDLNDRLEYLRGKNPVSPDYQEDIAMNKTPTQWPPGDGAAGRAVDGTIDGNFNNGSVTRTGLGTEARWEVDLGAVQPISWICLWNRTDCCAEYLTDFYVFVSDTPFQFTTVQQTLQQAGVTAFYFSGQAAGRTAFAVGRTGRYVRVQLKGSNYLSLAEVQVFRGDVQKLTLNQAPTTQSSTYGSAGPNLAVDGNTDGEWSHNSVASTGNEAQAWWQVDLGAIQPIAAINLWKPLGTWGNGLADFYVFVSDDPFQSTSVQDTLAQAGVTNIFFADPAAMVTSLSVGRTGRYVRVQLTGQNYLALAEVQVFTGEAPTFAFGVLPDTQFLASIGLGTGSQLRYNNTIDTIRDWIPTENLKAVLCAGDLVHWCCDDPQQQQDVAEWSIASNAWKRLQGQCLVAIAPGNHDCLVCGSCPYYRGCEGCYEVFNGYFDWLDDQGQLCEEFGRYTPDKMQNAYWRKTVGGLPFLFLTLEFATNLPQDYQTPTGVIQWAQTVVSAPSHQNDLVVLITHNYLWGLHRDYLWNKLINDSPNVVMVLCGHLEESTRNQRPNQAGRTVNEIRFDYQGWDERNYPPLPDYIAGLKTSAMARLMTVDPLCNRVRVKQWGCEMGGWLGLSEGNFEFTLPVDPRP